MKIEKKLERISKDFEKLSKRLQKLTAAMDWEKGEARRASIRKSAVPKRDRKSGTQRVLTIIDRSRNGIDAKSIIKKTGFEDKKIRNILFKASQQGKIERVERGVYRCVRSF
jgi:predicted Rossmann fold nucleotide-binding protein DprA/Smf involved in DNA uptake